MRRTTLGISFATLALVAGGALALPASASAAPVVHKAYSVTLACTGAPCGTDGQHYAHGEYYVKADNLPANTTYVTTVVKPDGTPYPFSQYSHPGTYLGQTGSIGKTDKNGHLSTVSGDTVTGWQWYAGNGPSVLADPAGTYGVTITFEKDGRVYHVTTFLVEKLLATPVS